MVVYGMLKVKDDWRGEESVESGVGGDPRIYTCYKQC